MFNLLLPTAIKCGVSVFEFWDMTLKEINLVINCYIDSQEEKRLYYYNLASMIAIFVNNSLSGEPIPSYYDVFPKQDQQVEKEDKSVSFLVDQWKVFAENHNKNSKKEGESK